MSAIAYKRGKVIGRQWLLAAMQTVAIGVLGGAVIPSASGAVVQSGEAAITCTNPYSGASWQIRIDYDRRTVESNPARISETEISWHDALDGRSYTLDRRTGKLTVVVASSTGGSFLYDQCKPEK